VHVGVAPGELPPPHKFGLNDQVTALPATLNLFRVPSKVILIDSEVLKLLIDVVIAIVVSALTVVLPNVAEVRKVADIALVRVRILRKTKIALFHLFIKFI
jgi:hypothetical protein